MDNRLRGADIISVQDTGNEPLPASSSVGYAVEAAVGINLFLLESKVENPVGNVVIVPPFGKTSHDMFLFTFYLNRNGFNVFRFDPRDHFGLSSGSMENFSLLKLEKDIGYAMAHFNLDPDLPTILIGMSLSFPPVLKYSGTNDNINGLISIVGVVDPDYTINEVIGVSVMHYSNSGDTPPLYVEPFNIKVYSRDFLHGMVEGGYLTLNDSIGYLKRLKSPLFMIVTEKDEYVRLNDVEVFFQEGGASGELQVVKGVTHEIARSFSAVKKIAMEVVKKAITISGSSNSPVMPSLVELISESEKESEYLNQFDKDL